MTETGINSERVELDLADNIATIKLVRESQMNAFDEAMHHELRAALAKVAADPDVRAVVLTGIGRAFSAGQDLAERASAFNAGTPPDLWASQENNYKPLIIALAELQMPVICAVNGVAYGAGAGIAIACDIVIAARSARFQFGFVNVGLGPDCGASRYLPGLVGQARAMDIALTGRVVPAEEALAMGMVSRVVDDEALTRTASGIAREIAARSPYAVSAIKRQLRENPCGSLKAALNAERDAQAALGTTSEYREAVLRFASRSS